LGKKDIMEEKAEIIKWVRMGILKISRELAIDVMMRSRKVPEKRSQRA
jgi:hypothetical protein